MDANLRQYLIRNAPTGQLTEEEYQLYEELLDTDPTFLEEVQLEELLRSEMKALRDEAYYEASLQVHIPIRRSPFVIVTSWAKQYPYYAGMAAAMLLLVVGLIFWPTQEEALTFAVLKRQQMEVYAAEDAPKIGLGFAEGLPIGELPVQWVENAEQPARLSYVFCNDTLTLYLNKKNDIDSLSKNLQLNYESVSQNYSILLSERPPVILTPCQPKPSVLMP